MSGSSPDEPLSALTVAVDAMCPYCGEPTGLVIDLTVADQSYVEDCAVCCRPMAVEYSAEDGQLCTLSVTGENE